MENSYHPEENLLVPGDVIVMDHPLKFGVLLLQEHPWSRMVENCRLVESLGFDSVWVGDHFVNPHFLEDDWYDGWSILAALASCSSTIRIGTLVTNIIYRNPAVVAKQALTIDHISGGRLNLGIGATSKGDPSHHMTGVEVWETGERIGRFREFIEIVDLMLRNEITSFEGRYYSINEARMKPSPVQKPRPTLVVASVGERTLKFAAKYADVWNTYGGWGLTSAQNVDLLRSRNELLDNYCYKLGRNPKEISRSFMMGLTKETPFASPDAFHDFVGRLCEVGMSEFLFFYDYSRLSSGLSPDREMLERLATQTIPAIKAEFAG